jgi:type II secretory pathway component GspD/PulD (secretin)
MKLHFDGGGIGNMKIVRGFLGVTLAVLLSGTSVWAQTEAAAKKPGPESQRTFYLNNVNQPGEMTEVTTAVRNLLDPRVKIFPVLNQNAILMWATPDQLELAQKLLNDLDRPKKTYRLTYTITELDGSKRIGTQHFAMIVVSGQRTTLKEGSKVPITTGSYANKDGSSGAQSQVTYLDVGMNFDASLEEFANGVRLRTKVEQSNIAEERSGLGAQDPVIRQTVLEGTSFLNPGKPMMLGSLDVPGSTRHLDVEVLMEQVH